MSGSCVSNSRSRFLRRHRWSMTTGTMPASACDQRQRRCGTSSTGRRARRPRTAGEVEEQRFGRAQRQVGLLERVLGPGQQPGAVGEPAGEADHVAASSRSRRSAWSAGCGSNSSASSARRRRIEVAEALARSCRGWSPDHEQTARARSRAPPAAISTAKTIFAGADGRARAARRSSPSPAALAARAGRREQRRLERDAVVGEPLRERRADAGALEAAAELAVLVDAHARSRTCRCPGARRRRPPCPSPR